MASFSEYTKKKKKEEQSVTGMSFSDFTKSVLGNNNIEAPTYKTYKVSQNDDIVSVKSTKKSSEKRTWFTKGEFEDGYDFGDVTKTILGTLDDVSENATTAVFDATENLIDTGADIVGFVGGLFDKDFEKKTSKFIARNLQEDVVDWVTGNPDQDRELGEVMNEWLNWTQPVGIATNLLAPDADESSILGEKADSLVQSATHVVGSQALKAIPGAGPIVAPMAMGVNAYGSEIEQAYQNGATPTEARVSGLVSAGAELLFEQIGGIKIFKNTPIDDVITKKLTAKISNKIMRTLVKLGIDVVTEGGEEVATEVVSRVGQKLTYMDEKSWGEMLTSEEALDSYLESFVGGAVMGGGFGGYKVGNSVVTGRDYTSGLTANEEAVVKKIYEDTIAEESKNGKVTEKRKNEIYDEVVEQLKNGDISTDTIEEVLGGETYKTYQDTLSNEEALQKEFDELYQMKQGEMTGEQIDRRAELKQQLEEIKNNSNKDSLKSQLSEEVYNRLTESKYKDGSFKDSRLVESYNEKSRRGQAFEADLTQYDAKQQEVVKRAVESGYLNNTRRTHKFVDMLAKISADKGVLFDFTDNEKIKNSNFAVDGKTVNAYVTKDGISLNMDSPKYMNSVVGHEITHILEGTELYDTLQQTITEYAKSKGDYQSRYDALTKLYENIEGANVDAELTADLVGDYLFTDSDFIRKLSTEHRNVFQKIYDEIKYLCKVATAGSKEARELEKVKKAFEDAYRKNVKANKNAETDINTDKKYSLSETDNAYLSAVEKGDTETAQKIVDKAANHSGYTIKAFHGGDKFFIVFGKGNKTSQAPEGAFFFSSNKDVAYSYTVYKRDVNLDVSSYPVYEQLTRDGTLEKNRVTKGGVYPVYLKMENPYVVDFGGEYYSHKINGMDINETAEFARANGYDGVIAKNIKDPGDMGDANYESKSTLAVADDYIVFNSAQIKSAETVTYDDNGNVIPLSQRFNKQDNDIRYSLSADSEGTKLSKGQQDFFKDSKMRDDNGNLKVMYHGSEYAGFHEFNNKFSDDDKSFFFVDRNDVAQTYSGSSEVYTARSFNTVEEFNKFFEEIDAEEYEVIKQGDKYALLENGDVEVTSDSLKELYDEFCDYTGLGQGQANYKVYLNLTNPLEVDAEGRNWNRISGEFSQEVYDRYQTLTEEEKTALTQLAAWEDASIFRDELETAVESVERGANYVDDYTRNLASAAEKLGDADKYRLFDIATDNFSEESLKENAVKYLNTRDYAQRAKEQGYDGVIFKNIVDNGGFADGKEGASTVAIAFDSNQIKSVANEKPTTDADIRYSLTEDSKGNKLSKEQQEFFKDSKIRVSEVDGWKNTITENGALLPVYHGTNSGEFYEFDKKSIGSANDYGWFGKGFYFAFTEGEASYYGKRVLECYLDVKNPFVYSEEMGTFRGQDKGDTNFDFASFVTSLADKFPEIAQKAYVEVVEHNSNELIKKSFTDFAKEIEETYDNERLKVVEINDSGEKIYQYRFARDVDSIDTSERIKEIIKEKYVDSLWVADFLKKEGAITRTEYDEICDLFEKYGSEQFDDVWLPGRFDSKEFAEKNRLSAVVQYLGEYKYSYIDQHSPHYYMESFIGDSFTKELRKRGYDGVLQSRYGDEIVVFDSNQIKLTDNKKPTSNPDIRYSLSEDSQGRELSKEQQNYFKDSKAVDDNGGLKVVYHGTRNANFTKFKRNINFFTDSKEMADSYSPNGEMFEGYVNITKPYEIDAAGEKWSKIPIDENTKKFLEEYGAGVFKEGGKWRTTPADIASAIEEAVDNDDMDYDGIIIKNIDDTGSYYKGKGTHLATDYIVFNSNQFKNADNKAPTEDPDIRYSLTEYTEEEKKAHNEAAVDYFGKTYSWNETGYLLLNGTKLDFSGKHDGAPGGYRTVDHRDISDALGTDYGGEDYSGSMVQFMAEGNIRIVPEINGINLSVKPTSEQESALSQFISRVRGEVVLDIDDTNGFTVTSAEYPYGTHSSKVLNDIREWFDNGTELPKYSLSQKGEPLTKHGNLHISGKDLKLETDIAPTKETVEEDISPVTEDSVSPAIEYDAPTTEEEANVLASENLESLSDIDAPLEVEDSYYEIPDTTSLDEKTLKNIGKSLKETLYLDAKETKAIKEIVQDYSTSEFPSKEELFNVIKREYGEKVWKEKNEEVAEVKRFLRNNKVSVSPTIKGDIADYSNFRKSYYKKLGFNNNGIPVDAAYAELTEIYPGFFPADITNPTDQLMRMAEVADMDINSYDSYDLDDDTIQKAVDIITSEVSNYKENSNRVAAEETAREELDDIAPAKATQIVEGMTSDANLVQSLENHPIKTVKERLSEKLRAVESELADNKQLRREAEAEYNSKIAKLQDEYVAKKDKTTKAANKIVQSVIRLERLKASVDANYSKRISDLEAKRDKLNGELRSGQSTTEQGAMRTELHKSIIDRIKTSFANKGFDLDTVFKKAKNLSTIATVDNTPQRVMEKSLGYEEGQILADETVNKVAQNESEGIKWLNSYTDRKNGFLAKISKKYNIKAGSKESAAAQMYAEGFYVDKDNNIIAYGDKELAADFPNAKVRENIKGLANDPIIREIYDVTLAKINEARARNAYPEIQKLDNYFLHFRAMNDTFSRLGLPFNPNDIKAKDLPTDLNGVTADLKPGQPFFASAMHRKGMRTSFDLLGGLESYLTSAKNQIYHIDDIQTLRALRNYIADTYGQANGLEGLDALSEDEAQERIKQVYNSHLSTFAKFLNEEANVIAGKTALIDRGIEGIIGRRGITLIDTINKQVGSNMIGFNVSSSLTNFLAGVQAIAKTSKLACVKSLAQTTTSKINSIFGKTDSFVENNPTIIRRKGAESFYRKPFQKISDSGYVLMSAVDNVTTEFIVRAKYNELLKKGMSEQQAVVEADKWTSRLMADRSLGQLPHLYNSKMLGLVTKFQLEVRNQLDSQFYDTIQEAKLSNKDIKNGLERNAKTAAKVTKTFFELAVLQHLFGAAFESVAGYNPAFDIISVLATAFGFDDEEDSEDTALDNIEQGFLELLEDLPYTSVITNGGRIPISSALPVKELISGKDEYNNEVSRWDTIKETAPYYVLPTGYGQIKKTTSGLSMFNTDEEHPVAGSYTDSGNLRFPVEDTVENRIQAGLFGQWANENARDYIENGRKPLKPKQTQEFVDVDLPIADYWKYREGLSDYKTLEEKAEYINNLDLETWQKNLLINNIADRKEDIDMTNYDDYDSWDEFDYAEKNPEKYEFFKNNGISYEDYANADEDGKRAYTWAYENPEKFVVSKAVANDVVEYRKYVGDLYDLKADKDEDGKSISGSRKEKVIEYINNLDADYGEKIILFKSEYNADDTYNYEIIDYLNSREDISYEEMEIILKELGFTVLSDGTIKWD